MFRRYFIFLLKSSCLPTNIKRQNQLEIVSEEEKKKIYKRRNLNIIIDQLRHTQTRSEPCSDE